MPRSEVNALTLVAVLIAAGLARTFVPDGSLLAQPLPGIALLLILFAFDREGYRDSSQSLAFGAVAGLCLTGILLPVLGFLKLGIPGLPWFPIIWVVGTLIFWAIDLSRMGKRVPTQQTYGQPAPVPAPAPIREEPIRAQAPPPPAPRPTPRPSSATSIFSQAPVAPTPEPMPMPTPPAPEPIPEAAPSIVPSSSPSSPPPSVAPPPQAVQVPRGSGKLTTIYLNLVGEGLAVMRSVQAEHVGKDYYLIVEEMPPGETWEFRTGQVVRCQKRNLSSGKGLVAVEEAPRAS